MWVCLILCGWVGVLLDSVMGEVEGLETAGGQGLPSRRFKQLVKVPSNGA